MKALVVPAALGAALFVAWSIPAASPDPFPAPRGPTPLSVEDYERAARAAEARRLAAEQRDMLNPTVRIDTDDGYGSGTALSKRLILTNHHVVSASDKATVRGWVTEGKRTFPVTFDAKVVAKDEKRDLALLELAEDWIGPVAAFASDDRPDIGVEVWVSGSPLGKRPQLTRGNVRLPRDQSSYNNIDAISVSAFVIWGNSGGGCYILSDDGRFVLVGVPHAITIVVKSFTPIVLPQIAYVLPVSSVRAFLRENGHEDLTRA